MLFYFIGGHGKCRTYFLLADNHMFEKYKFCYVINRVESKAFECPQINLSAQFLKHKSTKQRTKITVYYFHTKKNKKSKHYLS